MQRSFSFKIRRLNDKAGEKRQCPDTYIVLQVGETSSLVCIDLILRMFFTNVGAGHAPNYSAPLWPPSWLTQCLK